MVVRVHRTLALDTVVPSARSYVSPDSTFFNAVLMPASRALELKTVARGAPVHRTCNVSAVL